MTKEYKTSNLTRVFTLGLLQHGYKIDGGILYMHGLFTKKIPLDTIHRISYELIAYGQSMSYFYVVVDDSGKEFQLAYSKLDGNTYQELFRDILKINPNIRLTDEMRSFLDAEITEKILMFDFNVHKSGFFKRDRELSQKYPLLDAFIGFTVVFILFSIPCIFALTGDQYLTENFGGDYNPHRIWAIIIGGVSLAVAITNLFISLVSMYPGHALTFVCLIISLIGLLVGIMA